MYPTDPSFTIKAPKLNLWAAFAYGIGEEDTLAAPRRLPAEPVDVPVAYASRISDPVGVPVAYAKVNALPVGVVAYVRRKMPSVRGKMPSVRGKMPSVRGKRPKSELRPRASSWTARFSRG